MQFEGISFGLVQAMPTVEGGRSPAGWLASELARPLTHQHGIRGGLTAGERKAEIRRRRAGKPEVAA